MKKKNLTDIKNDLSYSDDQRREVEKRLERLKEGYTDQQQKVLKNKKELQSQFDSIRLTDEKILDGDTTLGEKIKNIFRGKRYNYNCSNNRCWHNNINYSFSY